MTTTRLRTLFDLARLGTLVDVHNPLDLTPMAHDAAFDAAVRHLLDDGGVDVGVVGCVPLTAALNTIVPGRGHTEDLLAGGAIGPRLVALHRQSVKAWVAVVDAGTLYDPLVRLLEAGGVPTFRSADRAMRIFGRYCAHRAAQRQRERCEASVDEFALAGAERAYFQRSTEG